MKIENKTKIKKRNLMNITNYLLDESSPSYVPNNRMVQWEGENGESFQCSADLWNMYLNGNVKVVMMTKSIKSFINKRFIDLFIYLTDLVKSDLELMYQLCLTGTHHNGRDIDWLEKEGLVVTD